ncbi:ParA family protein [Leptolyngbya sp. FACHB-261]|uniref:ParA family protein n=1 Tax=Leptolyngbya sp. FACHB-261 TaxID=2692806 RepID=UPI0016827E75|nr:ParA family protein [Leptolyngbya sp. FACHB-261]MBD2101029.1 ParA family protein [Leptolyngbya sp. FACHB-261]
MLISFVGFKGGVGKSTSSMHLAGYLSDHGGTLLIDGDQNRTALNWAKRGPGMPFSLVDETQIPDLNSFVHVVVDTPARPAPDDLEDLAKSDLCICPATPSAPDLEALLGTIDTLSSLGARYKVLLTLIQASTTEGEEAQSMLVEKGIPVFQRLIRGLAVHRRAADQGCLVRDAKDNRGRRDPMAGRAWAEYRAIGEEVLHG